MLPIDFGKIILLMSLILVGYTFDNKRVDNCHWNDNLAEKDGLCFQSPKGQIMVLSPKLKPSEDVENRTSVEPTFLLGLKDTSILGLADSFMLPF